MGKGKDTSKEVMPSTTRSGNDLPSRPNFSPNVVSTVAAKKKKGIASKSPLSKMSTSTSNDQTLDNVDKELASEIPETIETPEANETPETTEIPESSVDENVELELERNETRREYEYGASSEEEEAFIEAFISPDYSKLDKLSKYDDASIGNCFTAARTLIGPAIRIRDKDYEFHVPTEMIEIVEKSRFYGKDEESPLDHIAELHTLSTTFGNDEIRQRYLFLKLFPFSLGEDARVWFNRLAPACITSKEECMRLFFNKYFPAERVHALTVEISNFKQDKKESLPQAWGRFGKMCKKCPMHGFKPNELLDIFYNGLMGETRDYLDSIAGNIFRDRSVDEATKLLESILENEADWNIEEIDKNETLPEKKGGILELNQETMAEASKDINEKGIKTSHLKELSEMGIKLPTDEPCFPIQVNSILPTEGNKEETPPVDVSYVNNFAYHDNPEERKIRMTIMENHHKINFLRENLNASVGEVKRIVKHCEMMNNQVEQMISLQNQLYENLNKQKQLCGVNTRGGASTQDPDYPDDHPKRKEQVALKDKSFAGKSPNENEHDVDSNEQDKDISISDAETEDDNNEEEESSPSDIEQHDDNNEEAAGKEDPQPPIEKTKKKKKPNKGKDKGKERDPWVQRPIPYPQEVLKTKDEERYGQFYDMIKNMKLEIPLIDAIKNPPYSKYMKDIVTNKRKIPIDAITAMLADYSFKGKLPEKRGDPGIPTIPCKIKEAYVKYALCDLGAGVSVMPFSLYKKLNLNKLVPTEISLQMADKTTAVPIGICEDVPISIANELIPTDFVILEMPEDDNLSIILGRPFLNTAGAVINCTESKVTFHVKGNEHTIYFPKKKHVTSMSTSVNAIQINSIKIGSIEIPIPLPAPRYEILMIGTIPIKYEVT